MPDGSVELAAAGEPRSIEALVAWLWEGPPSARVSAVSVAEFDGDVESGFRVRQ